MPTIEDDEFGPITIRRSPTANQIRIRVAPNGSLRASMPMYAPVFLLKRMIKQSRDDIRALIHKAKPDYNFFNGMPIGKSHTLVIQDTDNQNFDVRL
ncbi:M48 family metallopeptidase, partial [Candidatus Saccharibacteria bacterium]|nr:M48 family metallopeptidase [Candidatus Saccharibacteria bacterium]